MLKTQIQGDEGRHKGPQEYNLESIVEQIKCTDSWMHNRDCVINFHV